MEDIKNQLNAVLCCLDTISVSGYQNTKAISQCMDIIIQTRDMAEKLSQPQEVKKMNE